MAPPPSLTRSIGQLGVLLLVSTAAAACSGKDPYNPGTKLGTFHVAASLVQTTCGQAPNPWEFDVRLNHDQSTLYWIQGGTPVHGLVDPAARANLEFESVHELRAADPKTKTAACSVARKDMLALTLMNATAKPVADPGETTSFTGALVYSFAPTDGSDCADQVTAMGGGFDALPCEVRYDVTGTVKSPAP